MMRVVSNCHHLLWQLVNSKSPMTMIWSHLEVPCTFIYIFYIFNFNPGPFIDPIRPSILCKISFLTFNHHLSQPTLVTLINYSQFLSVCFASSHSRKWKNQIYVKSLSRTLFLTLALLAQISLNSYSQFFQSRPLYVPPLFASTGTQLSPPPPSHPLSRPLERNPSFFYMALTIFSRGTIGYLPLTLTSIIG